MNWGADFQPIETAGGRTMSNSIQPGRPVDAAEVPLNILFAEHLPVVRSGLSLIVNSGGGRELVASTFAALVERVSKPGAPAIDLIVLDLALPGLDGAKGIARLRASGITQPILAITDSRDPAQFVASAAAGAGAVLPYDSSASDLRKAAVEVMAGRSFVTTMPARATEPETEQGAEDLRQLEKRIGQLTPRQREVLTLLSMAKSNKEIARELDLTEATVKVHVYAVFNALGVHKRMEAVAMLSRLLQSRPERRSRPRNGGEGTINQISA